MAGIWLQTSKSEHSTFGYILECNYRDSDKNSILNQLPFPQHIEIICWYHMFLQICLFALSIYHSFKQLKAINPHLFQSFEKTHLIAQPHLMKGRLDNNIKSPLSCLIPLTFQVVQYSLWMANANYIWRLVSYLLIYSVKLFIFWMNVMCVHAST